MIIEGLFVFEYGRLYACAVCGSDRAVELRLDNYGEYLACLFCGMHSYPDQFEGVAVAPYGQREWRPMAPAV